MTRIDLARLQAAGVIFLLALFFTASIGGVTAGTLPPANSDGTISLAAKTKKPTRTPTPTETRKPKKTKTPSPTPTKTSVAIPTETETPVDATATETPTPEKTKKPEKTRTPEPTATETPVPPAGLTKDELAIDASRGGTLAVEDGAIVIHVPAHAFSQDATLRFRRVLKDNHPKDRNNTVVVNRFRLNALLGNGKNQNKDKEKQTDKQDGKKKDKNAAAELTQFDQAITIEIHYDEATLGSWSEETLQIVYWDETLNRWMPLESNVDTENNVITAETTHFTDFGLASAPDLQNYLPSLEGFQTDLFTGAAGYSFPLNVPPGVGGLTPRLSLSYSSAGTDLFNSNAQASYVGAGWSMDTSYVARDTHGTRTTADDSYSLVLNGSGYDLVEGENGRWHTGREQFWRIKFINENQTWEVVTNDGTTYRFGDSPNGRAVEIRKDEWNNWYSTIYQFWLEKVTDTHGNTIQYTYDHQGNTCSAGSYDVSVRPGDIEYNWNGSVYLTKIHFTWSTRQDRNLYYPANQCGPAPFEKKKLDRVTMNTTDEVGMQVVRAYGFTYDYSTSTGVASTREDGTVQWGRLTLLQIAQYGNDDETNLPPTVFTYTKNRLNTGTNSIGGKVQFVYDEVDAGPHSDKYDQDYTAWTCGGSTCSIPSYAFWTKVGGSGYTFDVRQDPLNEWALAYQVPTTSDSNYLRWKVEPYIPNSNYVFTNTLTTSSSNVQVQFRLYDAQDGSETNLNNWTYVTPNTAHDFVLNVALKHNVRTPQLRLYAKDTTGAHPRLFIEHTLLQPLSTHHRVETKKVDDGLGHVNEWGYAYTGPATNDPSTSSAVNQANPRHPMYSQFRGHSKVTVTDPLGNVTQNFFDQGDYYAGKATEIRQRDNAGNNYVITLNEYGKTNYPTLHSYSVTGERIDFIKTISTTIQTYDGNNGAAPASKGSEFTYDTFGNISTTLEYSGGTVYRKTFKEYYPADVSNGQHITNKTARVYVTDITGAVQSETRYVYDDNTAYNQIPTVGDLQKVQVTADGSTFFDSAVYEYDIYGNVTSVTDARGKKTTTTFDTQYHLFAESVDPPLLPATTSTYDPQMGLLTSTTDPNGATTETGYDIFGRRTSIRLPIETQAGGANTAEYVYTLGTAGTPTQVQVKVRRDLGGGATAEYQSAWYFYDGLGRLIQKQTLGLANGSQARIIVVNTEYDERGKVKRVSQPYYVNVGGSYGGAYQTPSWGANTYFSYEYDPIGRTKKVTNPDGTYSTTTYNHWLTTSTDPNGHKKDFLSDAFGRTTQVQEYQSGEVYAATTYAYDRLDRLTDTTDDSSNTTHLDYDSLGRKTGMQDPDMGTWSYAYDNAGNLLRQTDARGNSVCFVYDDLNRVTTKTARTGTDCNAAVAYTVNYGYDAYDGTTQFGRGRRTSMSDPTGTQAWVYDKQGRISSSSQTITGAPGNPYNTPFTYDAMDRARTMTYPDDEVVTNVYNNQGLPDKLDGSLNNFITASNYNAASQPTSLTFQNGAVTNYTYNAQTQRLTDIVTTQGTTLLNVHYTFDNVGNILSAQDNVGTAGTTNYTYDDLDRLLSASVTNGANQYSRSWTYNEIGNMSTRTEGGSPLTYNYQYDPNDPHKKPHAVTSAGSNYFCYDANGNMTRRNATSSGCASGGDTMSYDVENRMTSMVAASNTTNFAYNGDGARMSREVVGVGTTYYIGNYYEVWVPASGTTTFNKYYFFGAQRIAARIAGTLLYMQGDHLGSSSLVMTSSGTLNTRQTYFPYGAKRVADGSPLPSGMDTTFTGQKSDDSTGLMYYGARYYDTSLGRFTQADTIVPNPMDPQSLNRYSYVRNNPVNLIDPTGHEDCAPEDDWCWQNRWFEAHGQCWSDAKQDWSKSCEPEFQDEGIIDEVIAEAGIDLMDPLPTYEPLWTPKRKEAIARAVALFGQALSGGIEQLHHLLGGGTIIFYLGFSMPPICRGSPGCAPPWPISSGSIVFMSLDTMTNQLDRAHMVVVHELAHMIDWHSDIGGKRFSDAWAGAPLSPYGRDAKVLPNAERFAEAVSVYVFRASYADWAGEVFTGLPDYEDQMRRMQALLEGWF